MQYIFFIISITASLLASVEDGVGIGQITHANNFYRQMEIIP